MRSFAIVSLLAATALAQQQQQQSASSPMIPNGISAGCKTALEGFDSDPSLGACTNSIIAATKDYTSGAKTATAAGMTASLDALCAASSCSETTVRTILAQFYQSCQVELTSSPNKEVVALYEVIYSIAPFKTAVCSKDESGHYCATQIADRVNNKNNAAAPSNGIKTNLVDTSLAPSEIRNYLEMAPKIARRAPGDGQHLINGTTFSATNLLFLFLTPSLDAATLCTSCTRNILTAYINFETNVPYAPAKDLSVLLSGQLALYNGIQSTCGASFLGGAVQAAGGIGSNGVFSGALSTASTSASLTLGLGIATLALAALL